MRISYDLLQQPTTLLRRLIDAFTKNITFEDNLRVAAITVADTGLAGTEFTVAHNLGKIPIGYIVTSDRPAMVYDSSVAAWTTSIMKLKCSTPNAVLRLTIF